MLGVRDILIIWQLVFASCHCLIRTNNNKVLKGCVMVIADPLDLGHGKNNKSVSMLSQRGERVSGYTSLGSPTHLRSTPLNCRNFQAN